MQISATLIAAQQAAREAQARFQAANVSSAKPDFTAALAKEDSFAPLPMKQLAPSAQPAPDAMPAMRPGSLVDIKI